MNYRVKTDESSTRKREDLKNTRLESKQPQEKMTCSPLHSKRPRREALLHSHTDSTSIRLTISRAKATLIHAVLFLALGTTNSAYVPMNNVAVVKSESKVKSSLASLRFLQEFWSDPNEKDVTPAPFATNNPTLRPSTQRIITPPSVAPTSKPLPAPVPINSSTQMPTVLPNNETQELPPSSAPSVDLSEAPTQKPSRNPSQRPTAASQMPSVVPSGAPSKERSLQPSNAPTDRVTQGVESEEGEKDINLTPVSMPINFKARLEGVREDDIDELLPRVATIWRTFFRDALEEGFGQSSFVSVELAVTAENERRRLRILQTDNVVDVLDIYAKGQISMRFDDEEAAAKTEELRSFLGETISRENLQNALTSSNTNFAVTVDGQNENKQKDDPKLWEIILGFTILSIALGTVVFWALFFWRKREKRIRKKKLAAIRSAPMGVPSSGTVASDRQTSSFRDHSKMDAQPSSRMMILPLSEGPRQASSAVDGSKTNVFIGRALTENDSDDDDSASKAPESDDSDTGSEFGRQLRMAASLDRASWEEFQRQKQTLELAARSGISLGGEHDGKSDRYNASLYELGDEHQAIEVEHGAIHPTIFPYGDEKGANSSRSRSSVSGADRYGTQDHGDSEPYGDLKDIPLGKAPYPFARQELDDPGSSDDQSDSSFRASPTDSTWSGGDLTDMDEPVGTLSMLKEVEQLSQYVQQYEQKRESRKMRELELKQREFHNKQRLHLAMSAGSQERAERQFHGIYPAEAPSKQGEQTDEAGADYPGDRPREAYAIPQRSVLPSSFESFHSSTDLSDAEDDVSQRLGITPQYPLLSDNNSNIHNKKDRPETKVSRRKEVENVTASVPYASHGGATSESKPLASRRTQSGEQSRLANHPEDVARGEGQRPLHSRSTQGKISNIVTMFESKPHTAVVPPSPSWQYEN